MSLFIRKPLAQLMAQAEGSKELRRTLGPGNLVALGVGAIIGAGLFSITGLAAAANAGPAPSAASATAAKRARHGWRDDGWAALARSMTAFSGCSGDAVSKERT